MSKKYEQLAKEIVQQLGGKENITDAYHCQTRLRFKLADESKLNKVKLEELDGVTKYIHNAGVHQVVIGTHVKDVFEEVEKNIDVQTSNDSGSTEKKGLVATVIDFVSGTFQPVIPALSGAGMVKAVLALLIVFKVITPDSQTYYMLNLFADGVFFFLPMILAFTVAQKLRCNPILAVSVAAMMLHPNWGALVTAGEPVNFFGFIPFTLATYTGSVIPILIVIFFQSYVEKFLNKVIPKSVELVFVPMFTFLIMGTLAFALFGPIGSILGGYLATFFTFLSVNASWVPAVLIGGLLPVMVMFGLHNGVAPLGVMQMAELGYDSIFGPGALVSNIAQATAAAVVAFRTKNKKIKQVAISGSITAYMGITEPVLYGVNLP
ncbi:MAG TPA: PTS transporter subunit EIIC, partial [Enterococcus sp.]|nr:PTS transporter subunit EIIC [Enterococcus sp.]